MASQPIDQGAILASGRAVVPDVAAQLVQQALLNIHGQQAQSEATRANTAASVQQRTMDRQTQYQAALHDLGANPSSQALTNLILRFPEFGEDVNRARTGMNEDQRRTDRQQLANVAAAATAGNYTVAAQTWRRRLGADRAAGQQVDPIEETILADLESAEPTRQRAAASALGHMFAAMGDNFEQDLRGLGLSGDRGFHDVNGVILDNQGSPISQDPRGRIVPGSNGSFYQLPPLPGIPGFGGAAPTPAPPPVAAPTSRGRPRQGANAHLIADGSAAVRSVFPSAEVTQGRRDPNSELGRETPNSWHVNSGAAVDIRPIPGMTFNTYVARLRGAGYQIIEARDEVRNPSPHATGPHWHVVLGRGQHGADTIFRVRSRQDYDGLASGTMYIPPDGSAPRVKP